MTNLDFTKIDFEKVPGGILIKEWEAGWKEGSQPTVYDFLPNERLDDVLSSYEKNGFCVHLFGDNHGRALKGEITRIDFLQTKSGWKIDKYPYGWTAQTPALQTEQKSKDFDVDSCVSWCRENGWEIRIWDGGARAWRDKIRPVRDAETIKQMRANSDRNLRTGFDDPRWHMDLAFEG